MLVFVQRRVSHGELFVLLLQARADNFDWRKVLILIFVVNRERGSGGGFVGSDLLSFSPCKDWCWQPLIDHLIGDTGLSVSQIK